ncbi:MAG: hypothetical protein WBC69_19200 [Geitlerinemataceae cyanobacterium]
MTYEELKEAISEIAEANKLEDWKLVRGSCPDIFSLKLDGKWLCFEEPSATVLVATIDPESWRAKRDLEIEEMLSDLHDL